MVKILIIAFIFSLNFSNKVIAGPFTDNLTRCIILSTSDTDYKKLVNWMFRVFSEHPYLKSNVGSVYSENQKTKADVNIAEILGNLLTKRCRAEAIAAAKYEPDTAIKESFRMLGELAVKKINRR
jgi:hypothetical protein